MNVATVPFVNGAVEEQIDLVQFRAKVDSAVPNKVFVAEELLPARQNKWIHGLRSCQDDRLLRDLGNSAKNPLCSIEI